MNKIKLLIALFLIITLIPSVQAELINPSFETGDLTGWVAIPSGSYISDVQTSVVTNGNYAYHMRAYSGGNLITYQNVQLSGVDNITFWAYVTQASYNREFQFQIDTHDIKLIIGAPNGGWTKYTIDVSAYTGIRQIQFHTEAESTAYVDNVRFDGVGWNPTLSGTVTSSTTSLPLDGASVSIHDDYGSNGSKTAVANETGYYEITNITSGIWRIQAAAFDYDEWHENDVTINSDMTRDIEMVYNPIPTEEPTTPVIVAIAPSTPDSDNDDERELIDDGNDKTIIDDIQEFIDDVIEGFQAGIGNLMKPIENLMEPITEPIQSIYEEIIHTTETSSFLFILFAYFGALVASLLLFYTSENEIDIPTILLSGTIGWIIPLVITFTGIITLVFVSGILTGLVFAIFGFVVHVLIDSLSSE